MNPFCKIKTWNKRQLKLIPDYLNFPQWLQAFQHTEFQKHGPQPLVDIRKLVKDVGKKHEPNTSSFSIEQVLTLLQFQKLNEDLQQPEKTE